MRRVGILVGCVLGLAACNGDGGGAGDDDDAAGDGGFVPDGGLGTTECSDGVDNDGDGAIDGFDVECVSGDDDREDSFATGIPGDNIDAKLQDCFFDGNSGGGDDKCAVHTCCILTLAADSDCPVDAGFSRADDCGAVGTDCITNCLGAVTPGCDCFGCCTLCDGAGCQDVFTNPAVAPDCDEAALADPTQCPPCTKVAECESPCQPIEPCVLCPGQDPSDLPASCTGGAACPNGQAVCTTSAGCGAEQFCAQGCCVQQIN